MATTSSSPLQKYAVWIIGAVVVIGFLNALYPDALPSWLSSSYRARYVIKYPTKATSILPSFIARDAIQFEDVQLKQFFFGL